MKIESKTTGRDEVLRQIDAYQRTPRVAAACAAEGTHSSGSPNVVIARANAKNGRDPFFLDPSDDSRGDGLVLRMVEAWQRGDLSRAMVLARELAQIMVDAVKRHIREGRGKDGPFKPLTPRYAAIKEHVKGGAGKPILELTGEFQRSLTPKTQVKARR